MPAKHWSSQDEELLRDCCLKRMTIEEVMPLFPDRTVSAIRARSTVLGVPMPMGAYRAEVEAMQAKRPSPERQKKYNCSILDGFLQQCEADTKGIAEAQTAAAMGDCPFGRRCSTAKGKRCVAKMPGPMLPAAETKRGHRKM